MKITFFTLGTAILFSSSFIITPVFAGQGHDGESNAGGHMDRMNNIRQTLEQELGDEYNKAMPKATSEQLSLGKEVFNKDCVACHGESGKGDGPAAAGFKQKPADFTDAKHSKFYSDQGRVLIIKKGIDGTPMPGWQNILNEEEILSVHSYIRSLRKPISKEKHGEGMHTHSM